MRTLLFLLAFVFTGAARAEVVVYKGSGTCRQPNDVSHFGPTPRLYYIVDLSTHDSYPIFYFTLNGQKKSSGSPALNPTYYNAAPGFNGKTIGVFNFVFDSGSVTNPATLFFYFRGKAVTVPVSSSSNSIFPETLTGNFSAASPTTTAIPSTIKSISSSTTTPFHTKAANNALKSGATVLQRPPRRTLRQGISIALSASDAGGIFGFNISNHTSRCGNQNLPLAAVEGNSAPVSTINPMEAGSGTATGLRRTACRSLPTKP
jgi:hypothetical protein